MAKSKKEDKKINTPINEIFACGNKIAAKFGTKLALGEWNKLDDNCGVDKNSSDVVIIKRSDLNGLFMLLSIGNKEGVAAAWGAVELVGKIKKYPTVMQDMWDNEEDSCWDKL